MLWTLPVPIIHQKFFLAYANLVIFTKIDFFIVIHFIVTLTIIHFAFFLQTFFLLSSLPAFPCGLRGQQLEIKPLHYTVFDPIHHFAWVKSQAIPSKIPNVIDPSSSTAGRPTGLLPFALADKACLGSLS